MAFTLSGFKGFVPFAELPTSNVPRGPGVYVVTRPAAAPPVFLPTSPAGWCRGEDKDPTVSPAELHSNWIPGEPLLYIGKAAAGKTGTNGLRKRLALYRRNGIGKNSARHWGGRYIWQLADSAELLVGWREEFDARPLEKSMLADFKAMYSGKRPFANLSD
jgi:hypothetical protein